MRFFIASAYNYWGNFNPDDEDRQIGGGETAMINIARELAALGQEVLVFYDCRIPGKYSGVDYVPTNLFVQMACTIEHDVLVVWDAPHLLRYKDLAGIRILAFQLNDAFVGPMDWTIDFYFHPSLWHVDRFTEMYPEMDKRKCAPLMTNGIQLTRYTQDEAPPRNPNRVIYSSSPDRGLHHLLRIWPGIRDQVPEAELHVFYDMDKWLQIDAQLRAGGLVSVTGERALEIHKAREAGMTGVLFRGGVGKRQLALEQRRSAVMAYPCDPVAPTEGFSMSILEGITAGCKVITTNADALPELWADSPGVTILPLPVDDALWTEAIVKALKEGYTSPELRQREDLEWTRVAQRWLEVLGDSGEH